MSRPLGALVLSVLPRAGLGRGPTLGSVITPFVVLVVVLAVVVVRRRRGR
ncbi:hypothetical protein [Cellulomonas sp. 73-92]|nr:hypothetical protein [Cellulomonas sp. 73-92]